MKNFLLLFVTLGPFCFSSVQAQQYLSQPTEAYKSDRPGGWAHGRIRVAPDGHFLQYDDGTPFFWLGDTGWELFHRLKLEEIKTYFDDRHDKGFTVIQAALIAEFDGLRKPNRYGQLPVEHLEPFRLDEAYFRFVDSVVRMAGARGLCMALLPTWGDKVTKGWGTGPVIFDSALAYKYGLWLGQRYKAYPNIIWVLGGDRPARNETNDWTPVWRQMARGIIESTAHQCLITYHPAGGTSSSKYLSREAWLDVNMFQSGHGAGHDVPCWEMVARDRSIYPPKPTLDGEPNYEDHPVNPWPKWDSANGYFRDYDVRKQCYRSVFAGACGVTYGHHAVWQFYSPNEEKINYADRYWTDGIHRPGAYQVGYLRKLIETFHAFNRVPDSTLIVEGQGVKGEHCVAFRNREADLAMIYLPVGRAIRVNMTILKGQQVRMRWFNPRDNSYTKPLSLHKIANMPFTPPESGVGKDWVLVLSAV